MNTQSYFYQFLEPFSKELAHVARELENSIFSGPRTMLTHARVFVENILIQIINAVNRDYIGREEEINDLNAVLAILRRIVVDG